MHQDQIPQWNSQVNRHILPTEGGKLCGDETRTLWGDPVHDMQARGTSHNEQCMDLRLGTDLTSQSGLTMKDSHCTLIQLTVQETWEVTGLHGQLKALSVFHSYITADECLECIATKSLHCSCFCCCLAPTTLLGKAASLNSLGPSCNIDVRQSPHHWSLLNRWHGQLPPSL